MPEAWQGRALPEGQPQTMHRRCWRRSAISDEVAGSGPRSTAAVFADWLLQAGAKAVANCEPSCRISIILIKYMSLYLAIWIASVVLLL